VPVPPWSKSGRQGLWADSWRGDVGSRVYKVSGQVSKYKYLFLGYLDFGLEAGSGLPPLENSIVLFGIDVKRLLLSMMLRPGSVVRGKIKLAQPGYFWNSTSAIFAAL
jgi:hypothetical protein